MNRNATIKLVVDLTHALEEFLYPDIGAPGVELTDELKALNERALKWIYDNVPQEHPYRSTTHEEHFIHLKIGMTKAEFEAECNKLGGFMTPLQRQALESQALTFYEGNGKPVTHTTYFLRKEENELWYVATAICSYHDQFDRNEGRKQARKHYFQGHREELDTDYHGFMARIYPKNEDQPTTEEEA